VGEPLKRSVGRLPLVNAEMKLRKISFTSLVLALVYLSLLPLFLNARSLPEEQKQGRVSGMVLDIDDSRITKAKVTLMRDPETREILTDEEGKFDVQLPAGVYRLTVSADGFCKFEKDDLVITSGATDLINIHLEVVVYDSPDACKCTARRANSSNAPPNKAMQRTRRKRVSHQR
jgi:hypothetical protein